MAVGLVIALLRRELDDARIMADYYPDGSRKRDHYNEYAHQLEVTIHTLCSLGGERLLRDSETP